MERNQIVGYGNSTIPMGRANSSGDAKAPGQRMISSGAVDLFGEPAAMISGETIGQLMQMQSGFKELKALRDRERASSHKLVEVLRSAMFELDVSIPLSNGALSSAFADIREGWLSPDSTVVVTDSSGNRKSIPLQDLPPHTIASILQECAIKMNEVLSQKLDRVGRSIDLLENAVQELSRTVKPTDRGVSSAVEPRSHAQPPELPNEREEVPQPSDTKTESNATGEEVKRFTFTGIFK